MIKPDICLTLSLRKGFDNNNPSGIIKALNDNLDITKKAIDFSTNDDDGVISEGSTAFTGIYYDKGRSFVTWSFEWSVFSACQDHYYEAKSKGSTEIWLSANELRLKSFKYPEKPSTADEF